MRHHRRGRTICSHWNTYACVCSSRKVWAELRLCQGRRSSPKSETMAVVVVRILMNGERKERSRGNTVNLVNDRVSGARLSGVTWWYRELIVIMGAKRWELLSLHPQMDWSTWMDKWKQKDDITRGKLSDMKRRNRVDADDSCKAQTATGLSPPLLICLPTPLLLLGNAICSIYRARLFKDTILWPVEKKWWGVNI